MDLMSLPKEILPNIFKFLPLEDRRNVRLTCHLWNYYCNRPIIVESEKFVFRKTREVEDTNLTCLEAPLLRCKIIRSDFEFQGLDLRTLPSTVWRCWGDQVISLVIYECALDEKTISEIIVHCGNLVYWRIQISCHNFYHRLYDPYKSYSDSTLDELIEREVERPKLLSFELFTGNTILNKTFSKLFQIFPNIRTFGRGYRSLLPNEYDEQFYAFFDTAKWVFPLKIENFTSNGKEVCTKWEWPKLKFKGFRTMLEFDQIDDHERIFAFFSRQTELERLGLCIIDTRHDLAKKLLLDVILQRSSKLEELDFRVDTNANECFSFTSEELNNFLAKTSQLESLSLFFPNGFSLLGLAEPVSAQYARLKRLRLEGAGDLQIFFEIIRRCRSSLEYLYLSAVDNRIMREILTTHSELRTLHIEGFQEKYDLSKLRESFSVEPRSRFKSLQHLEIMATAINCSDLLHSLLFESPDLRYFYFETLDVDLNQADYIVKKVLHVLSRETPRLEILRLNHCPLTAAEFVTHCKSMKYLRFLVIENMTLTEDELFVFDANEVDVKQLFIKCPSLHWIASFRKRRAYFYDRSTNDLIRLHNFRANIHKLHVTDDC